MTRHGLTFATSALLAIGASCASAPKGADAAPPDTSAVRMPPVIGVVEIVTMQSGLGQEELLAATMELKQGESETPGLRQHYFVRSEDGAIGGVLEWEDEPARAAFRARASADKLAERLRLEGPPDMRTAPMIDRLFASPRADADDSADAILVVSGLRFGLPLPEVARVKTARRARFLEMTDLRQKLYTFNVEKRESMGVYLWSSRAAAEAYLASEFFATMAEEYALRAPPQTAIYDVSDRLRDDGASLAVR